MLLDIIVFVLVFIAIPVAFLKLTVPKIVSVTVGEAKSSESAPRRSALLKPGQELKTSPDPSVKTLWDVLLYCHAKFPSSQHLLGSRKLIKTVKEKKMVKKVVGGKEIETEKEWSFSELGPYNWLSVDDVLTLAKNLGAGLVHLGLKPGDKATIFHSTSKEWLSFSYACYSQSLTITTAYDSLGVEALAYSLNEAEVTTLLTQSDLMGIIKRIGDSVPTLKNVIYSGTVESAELDSIKQANPTLTFYSLTELEELGRQHPTEPKPPKPTDLACIMYTSGSTGNPKGVMITHASMVAAIAGACDSLEACTGVLTESGNYYLAYLPLAHVLEFLIENLCVFKGVALGYGGVRTLTDGSVRGCKGDIKELRPTLMAGVPAVWETIRKGIQNQLKQASPMQRYIFDTAVNLKKLLVACNLPHNFMDKIVFKKIADGTGGRLRAAISGGAPVAAQTQEFLSMVLCPLIQGYGMTECCGMMTVQLTSDVGTYASVGAPSTAAEIKLVACNNYDPNPAPGSGVPPRGELWVRGGIVMSGYYKQPQTTRENLTEDGWLMSGDIAEFEPNGSIKIIDRKKNLVKLAHGEYVALEKLEAQYKTSSYVANMCIHADPLESHIIALVVCDPKELSSLQKQLGLDSGDLDNESLIDHIQKDFMECARDAEFKGAEILKSFALVSDDWTPENGMLTAAQKIKRKEILSTYADKVDKLYGRK